MTSTTPLPTRPRHVLVATDFSDASDEALRQADACARMTGATLTALHVVPDVLPIEVSAYGGRTEIDLESRALDILGARLQQVTERRPHEVKLAVRTGRADVGVVRFAEENDVDMLVVGATGRTGLARLFLGSTAERIVRHAHCSVLIARPSRAAGHVLAAADLSEGSLAAIARAKVEAEQRGATLDLLHVIDLSALGWAAAAMPFGTTTIRIPDEQIAEMRALASDALRGIGGPVAAVHVQEGAPKQAIVALAGSLPAGLVVVGTHGRTGLARLALGSVAEAVVRAAPCSVLVVRQPAAQSPRGPESEGAAHG